MRKWEKNGKEKKEKREREKRKGIQAGGRLPPGAKGG